MIAPLSWHTPTALNGPSLFESSMAGKLVSQINLKREHWEVVIDSLNFALAGQGLARPLGPPFLILPQPCTKFDLYQ